jgi:hypothetical protein
MYLFHSYQDIIKILTTAHKKENQEDHHKGHRLVNACHPYNMNMAIRNAEH